MQVMQPALGGLGLGKPFKESLAFDSLCLPADSVAGRERSPGCAVVLPYKTVVTFHPHPREFFTGERRSLLTPLQEKAELLKTIGFDQLVLLPFNQELANLSPDSFVKMILVEQLKAAQVSVGMDFRFGYRRLGTVEELKAIAQPLGLKVNVVPLLQADNQRISSSAIRQALTEGDVHRANALLGRPYTLVGTVVQGRQLGRKLGFPTANLDLPADKFLPRYGVYAVRVYGLDLGVEPGLGVMNLGCRPTVQGNDPTAEVHLLDWSGDLYGKRLTVCLEDFLRPEQVFSSLEDLRSQIQIDCAMAHDRLASSQQTIS